MRPVRKRIVYTRPDGGVSVIVPVINTLPIDENITEEQALERAKKDIPADAINPRVVEEADIPVDRTFRNAWEDVGSLRVNMPKAREIHKKRLREARKPKLDDLDIQFMRALESGAGAAEISVIVQKKQQLRDVTADPAIAAAQTPDQLKAVWPDVLV